jgi:hypothetical protein
MKPTETKEPTMNAKTPSARWNLIEVVRFTAWDVDYVAYGDLGSFVDVIEAGDFDAETEEDDYSLWCSATDLAPLKAYRAAASLWGHDILSGAHGLVRAR